MWKAIESVFRPARHEAAFEPGRLRYGRIVDPADGIIDEVIVLRASPEGAGEPREEVEIHCHGGPASVEAISDRLRDLGLQRVPWTEYLEERARRAKAPRIQLEADLLLPDLATLRAVMLVLRQRNGLLARAVEAVCDELSARHEEAARAGLRRLIAAYESTGRHIAEPPRVAILGAANVGKSSLMNRLVGRERAIVTEVPGTTRDVVAEMVVFDGLPVVLADTAGLREGGDAVEQLGVERARAEAFRADVLVYLQDLSRPPDPAEGNVLGSLPPEAIRVGSKADLVPGEEAQSAGALRVSSVTGEGVDALVEAILAKLGFRWAEVPEPVPFTRRQARLLRQAEVELEGGGREAAARSLAAVRAPAE